MSAVDLTVESEIIEGFLCPMCMKDFGTITQLHCHFEDAHNADDRAGFRQFKGDDEHLSEHCLVLLI